MGDTLVAPNSPGRSPNPLCSNYPHFKKRPNFWPSNLRKVNHTLGSPQIREGLESQISNEITVDTCQRKKNYKKTLKKICKKSTKIHPPKISKKHLVSPRLCPL